MRHFVILGHTAALTPQFPLDDLPGGAGRLDVLCRAIGAAFFLSHNLRRDVEVTLLLQNQIQIRLIGTKLRRLNPDERSTAALLKHALERLEDHEDESTPGIFISRGNLSDLLDRLYQAEAHPIVLHEQGIPIDPHAIPQNPAFILSDHLEFTSADEATLSGLPRFSLSRHALHTSQCVTIIHYMLDRLEEDKETRLVVCHTVWGEPKALLIKGLLEDSGIPVNLVSHVPPSIFPMTIDGLAEVRVMVREQDRSRARQIIADYFEPPDDSA
jgi:tRNA (pseudouridine54-N1)-methyltransferase